MVKMIIKVPTGIGDVLWILQKFYLWEDRPEKIIVKIAKEEPHRVLPFLKLFDWLEPSYDNNLTTREVLEKGDFKGDFEYHKDHAVFIHANYHLQRGWRIEDFCPNLPTAFEIPMNLESYAGNPNKTFIGIFPASLESEKGFSNYGGWSRHQWVELINILFKKHPGIEIEVFGAEFDREMIEYIAENSNTPVRTIIGRDIDHVLALMQTLNYIFAFPSGMGILAEMLKIPCCMFMANHLEKMIGTWGRLESYESRYDVRLFPENMKFLDEIGYEDFL